MRACKGRPWVVVHLGAYIPSHGVLGDVNLRSLAGVDENANTLVLTCFALLLIVVLFVALAVAWALGYLGGM